MRLREVNYQRRLAGREELPAIEGELDPDNPCSCSRCEKMRRRDRMRRAQPTDDELDRRALPWLESHSQ